MVAEARQDYHTDHTETETEREEPRKSVMETLKNEQDVQLLERLAFMSRREANSK